MPSLPDARATRRLRPNLLLLGLVAVAAQSWALYSPGDPDRVLPLDIPGLDKVVHLALFAVPVWLLLRAGVRRLVVVPLAIVQVIASEVIQDRFVPHRSGDIWDAVADLVGIGLALWLTGRGARAETRTPPGDAGLRARGAAGSRRTY